MDELVPMILMLYRFSERNNNDNPNRNRNWEVSGSYAGYAACFIASTLSIPISPTPKYTPRSAFGKWQRLMMMDGALVRLYREAN